MSVCPGKTGAWSRNATTCSSRWIERCSAPPTTAQKTQPACTLAAVELEYLAAERNAGLAAQALELVEVPLADERHGNAGLARAPGAADAVRERLRVLR